MSKGSHHEAIRIANMIVGYARITNEGTILSIYIKSGTQQRLFLPEDGVLGIIVGEEE
jgi:hypothetical protein